MDTELRAPDPTLTALGLPTTIADDVAVIHESPSLTIAHRLSLYPEGDPRELVQWWPSCDPEMGGADFVVVPPAFAAYTAVPCRECFPDAPPPGYVNDCGCYTHAEGPCQPGLAWQLE